MKYSSGASERKPPFSVSGLYGFGWEATDLRERYAALKEGDRRELRSLLTDCVKMSEVGFAIDLESQQERWNSFLKKTGLHAGYRLMADGLSEVYRERYGRPYLFTENCMAYEIEYHADAFFWARGYRGYRRNITSFLFSREKLISHCRVIDISTDDTASRRQRLMFRYRRGVRPEYRNTPMDPFDRSPWPVRLLRRLTARFRKDKTNA